MLRLSFVSSSNVFTKDHSIPENQHITCCDQSTESPILFRSCGHETPFYDQKGASKIGDSVLWFRLSFVSSCKVFTKDSSIPEKPTRHITSHVATIFFILFQRFYKRSSHPRKPTHHITCNPLAKLLQKIVASHTNQHITSHVATILQRYHYFYEISLLFETTQQSLGPRNVGWNVAELSRTITRFHQNDDNFIQVRRRFVPNSRRQLAPILDKPAFSRISQIF